MRSQRASSFGMHSIECLTAFLLFLLLTTAFFPAFSTLPTGYRDRETLLQDFFKLMNQFPTLMSYESLGKSYQGRDIPMFMIGNPSGGKVLFTMVTHGDEVEGAEVGYYMAQWILERKEPEIADRILQNNLILIVIENIDSYGIKRKNMQLTGYIQGVNPDLYGIDLNRNMPVGWGKEQASSNMTSVNYEGSSPGSEPESQALISMLQSLKPKFHLNYHYGGGMIFYKPSVYANMSASVSQYHDAIAKEINSTATSRGVNVYKYGRLGISGDVTDQAYVSGNSTSYLLEAGNWPAPAASQIQSILLPRLLPFLIVFSQESEIVQKPFDGSFESGSFSGWTGTAVTPGETATVVNTMPYQGNFSARFASNGTGGFEAAYCYESTQASNDLYASGYFNITKSGITENNDTFYFIKFLAGNDSVACAGWRRVGGVDRWELTIRNSTGWTSVYSTSSPTINRWYKLEFYWTENAANGQSELDIDGTRICSIQNQNTTALGDVNQVRYGLAEIYGSGPTTVYMDKCQLLLTRPPWDINQDGKVNLEDLSIFAKTYGLSSSSPNWNTLADINGDGRVDLHDLVILALHYGQQYP